MSGVTTGLAGASNEVLANSIGVLTDEHYANQKTFINTGIASDNPDIDPNTETFIGQLRWRKPLNPTINVASLTDSGAGSLTSQSQDYLNYIKTARTHGAEKINLQKLITQEDSLQKISRDFAETRAVDENSALLSVLKGVAISEALYGAAVAGGGTGLGGQTFENDPTDKKYGFYVDIGASKLVADSSASVQGAQRAQAFLDALGMGFKDYEPEYAYLTITPRVLASLRAANLVDQDRVRDGAVDFETIFNGKFRLLLSRASTSLSSAELAKLNTAAGVNITGTLTSFIILPGAIAVKPLMIDEDVEIDRNASAYKGGGTTTLWYRWGYVLHPAGYSWAGDTNAFPSNNAYSSVVESGTQKLITAATDILANVTPIWERKTTSALTQGILPIFHS